MQKRKYEFKLQIERLAAHRCEVKISFARPIQNKHSGLSEGARALIRPGDKTPDAPASNYSFRRAMSRGFLGNGPSVSKLSYRSNEPGPRRERRGERERDGESEREERAFEFVGRET